MNGGIPMKISVNRLCKLAGIDNGQSSGRLNEGSNRSFHEDPYYQDEVDYRYGKNQLSEKNYTEEAELPEGDMFGEIDKIDDGHCMSEEDDIRDGHCMSEEEKQQEMMAMGMHEDPDEVIEIDERELVQELRRAKRLMRESSYRRQKQLARKASIDTMIEEEVAKMFNEYNSASSSWVYGDNKPRASRDGYVTRSFPGIGFGKKY